ncbi:MAG TPA: rhodanese-like domain-containing protein [Actinomycetota bacterium]|nr:rhodanese-like domain-containing protein [Actinomycetota bacterium]
MGLFRSRASNDLDAQELSKISENGGEVIDVRTYHEWEAGHLPFARHIPIDELLARAGELDKERLNVFICHVGARSQAASDALGRNGFKTATVPGGMEAAKAVGLPVIRSDGSPGRVISA